MCTNDTIYGTLLFRNVETFISGPSQNNCLSSKLKQTNKGACKQDTLSRAHTYFVVNVIEINARRVLSKSINQSKKKRKAK